MASSRALMSNLRALKQRLEEPPARGGGYRPKRSVNPRTVRPPRGPSPIAPKPVTGNRDLQQCDLKAAEQHARLDELRRARLAFIAGTGSDAEVQRAESRVHDDHVQPSRRVLLERLADARTTYIIDGRSAFGAARPDTSEPRVQVMHDSPGGVQVGGSLIMPPPEVNREYLKALAAERLEGVSFEEEHADVDALAVPEERRPSTGAPLRRLLGFLIRTLLRRWSARLEKRGR